MLFKIFDDTSHHVLLLQELNEKAKSITGVHQWPYRAVARALEVIPRTLIQNCGASTIRTLTALRVSGSCYHLYIGDNILEMLSEGSWAAGCWIYIGLKLDIYRS